MRNFVITIPIDPNLKFALFAIGQHFAEIADACDRLDITDPVFQKIHFPHHVKITEDKPDPWDEAEYDLQNQILQDYIQELKSRPPHPDVWVVSESAARKLSDITLGYAPQDFVNPSMLPKDSGIEIPTFEVMG